MSQQRETNRLLLRDDTSDQSRTTFGESCNHSYEFLNKNIFPLTSAIGSANGITSSHILALECTGLDDAVCFAEAGQWGVFAGIGAGALKHFVNVFKLTSYAFTKYGWTSEECYRGVKTIDVLLNLFFKTAGMATFNLAVFSVITTFSLHNPSAVINDLLFILPVVIPAWVFAIWSNYITMTDEDSAALKRLTDYLPDFCSFSCSSSRCYPLFFNADGSKTRLGNSISTFIRWLDASSLTVNIFSTAGGLHDYVNAYSPSSPYSWVYPLTAKTIKYSTGGAVLLGGGIVFNALDQGMEWGAADRFSGASSKLFNILGAVLFTINTLLAICSLKDEYPLFMGINFAVLIAAGILLGIPGCLSEEIPLIDQENPRFQDPNQDPEGFNPINDEAAMTTSQAILEKNAQPSSSDTQEQKKDEKVNSHLRTPSEQTIDKSTASYAYTKASFLASRAYSAIPSVKEIKNFLIFKSSASAEKKENNLSANTGNHGPQNITQEPTLRIEYGY